MIIIGFVVAIMLFSSFAIVFSNSGNIQNTSNKQILNLPEKSFTSKTNEIINLPNARNDLNSPIEFCKNYMIYDNNNNVIVLVNLSNNNSINTNITYDVSNNNFYYGINIFNNYIYIYALWYNTNDYPNLELDNYSNNLKLNSFSISLIQSSTDYQPIGITANNLGIFPIFNYQYSSGHYTLDVYKYSYSDTYITSICSTSDVAYANTPITSMANNGFIYAYQYDSSTSNGYSYFVNLYSNTMSRIAPISDLSGEIIYNNTYTNNFNVNNSISLKNTYISNDINYGFAYTNCYKATSNSQNITDTNYRLNAGGNKVSFTNAHYFINAYFIEDDLTGEYFFIYNNTNYGQIKTFDLPYTIYDNILYLALNTTSYEKIGFNEYNINIKSFNHNSKQIKNYFYFNNNIYYGNEFNFSNDNGIFSILPLNYSIYTYNKSYITTSSSEFKSIGNGIYEYNLSIYYRQLTTNTTSSIKPLDISSYIYPIGIIIFVSFLGAMVYFSKNEGKK